MSARVVTDCDVCGQQAPEAYRISLTNGAVDVCSGCESSAAASALLAAVRKAIKVPPAKPMGHEFRMRSLDQARNEQHCLCGQVLTSGERVACPAHTYLTPKVSW